MPWRKYRHLLEYYLLDCGASLTASRLNDRPKKIKAEILPYDECNTDGGKTLQNMGLIRYEVDGTKYIQVVNFDKHQNPHVKEQASEIPAPDKHSASTVQEQDKNQKSMEVAGLIPSSSLVSSCPHPPSLIPHPSSLIPDAGFLPTPLPHDSEKSADQESFLTLTRQTKNQFSSLSLIQKQNFKLLAKNMGSLQRGLIQTDMEPSRYAMQRLAVL